MTWKFELLQKSVPKLKKSIIIVGLPGIANVGKIAADFIIDEVKAKKLYNIFSHDLPNSVFVNDNNLVELPTIEMYAKNRNGVHSTSVLSPPFARGLAPTIAATSVGASPWAMTRMKSSWLCRKPVMMMQTPPSSMKIISAMTVAPKVYAKNFVKGLEFKIKGAARSHPRMTDRERKAAEIHLRDLLAGEKVSLRHVPTQLQLWDRGDLELEDHPETLVGVVEFNTEARTLCRFTNSEQRAIRCVQRVRSEGGKAIHEGISEGLRLIMRQRTTQKWDEHEVTLLVSDGKNDAGCAEARKAASKARWLAASKRSCSKCSAP